MIKSALIFVAVVKAGGFSKAAQLLGISKAQISRQIKQLETSLGIQLLFRTTRSLTLTESGEQLFLSCRDLEESFEEAIGSVKEDFQAIKGTLRITATISFGGIYLPKIIHAFKERYPYIKVMLKLANTVEDLVEKSFDLAFRIAPNLPDSSLRMRQIMTLEMVLIAAPAYLKRNKEPQSLDALKNLAAITSPNPTLGQSRVQWPYYRNQELHYFMPNSQIEVDGVQPQIDFALLGSGIARVPRIFVQQELAEGRLVSILPAIELQPLNVYLLYPDRKYVPKKLQVFLDFLKENASYFPHLQTKNVEL